MESAPMWSQWSPYMGAPVCAHIVSGARRWCYSGPETLFQHVMGPLVSMAVHMSLLESSELFAQAHPVTHCNDWAHHPIGP
jgi:hypothetical protein